MMIYWNRNKKGEIIMKKAYLKPTAYIEAFSANEYVAACYSLACKVGSKEPNPVDGTIWPSNSDGEEKHESSGTGNCSDAGSNYLTVDSNGNFMYLDEWRSDMKKWLRGTKVDYKDLYHDGKCGPGDYIAWNTSTSDGSRTWHHWGIATVANPKHPNHS